MTFPELPKGYRWRVTPHVNGEVSWVVVSIESTSGIVRLLEEIGSWFDLECDRYRISVMDPDDESITSEALTLHRRFMANRIAADTLPEQARQWESKLNTGAGE